MKYGNMLHRNNKHYILLLLYSNLMKNIIMQCVIKLQLKYWFNERSGSLAIQASFLSTERQISK